MYSADIQSYCWWWEQSKMKEMIIFAEQKAISGTHSMKRHRKTPRGGTHSQSVVAPPSYKLNTSSIFACIDAFLRFNAWLVILTIMMGAVRGVSYPTYEMLFNCTEITISKLESNWNNEGIDLEIQAAVTRWFTTSAPYWGFAVAALSLLAVLILRSMKIQIRTLNNVLALSGFVFLVCMELWCAPLIVRHLLDPVTWVVSVAFYVLHLAVKFVLFVVLVLLWTPVLFIQAVYQVV